MRAFIAYYGREVDPNIQSHSEGDGKYHFVIDQDNKRDLLICIPGQSHILSSKEIESYNTRLDTDDYRSVTVLSFGKISNGAKDMYLKLKSRKPLEVLVNQDLTSQWPRLLSLSQRKVLNMLDAAANTVTLLLKDDEVHLLIVIEQRGTQLLLKW